jgi:hypothetical protein
MPDSTEQARAERLSIATDRRRIRIGDLSPRITEMDLRGLLVAFGSVLAFRRPVDAVTRRPGDVALIDMADPGATRAVAALHGTTCRDRILAVNSYVLDALQPLRN